RKKRVPARGFEPRLGDSKSPVLPLDDAGVTARARTIARAGALRISSRRAGADTRSRGWPARLSAPAVRGERGRAGRGVHGSLVGRESMEAGAREPHHDEVPARRTGRPILVVEDDEDTVAALRMLLADEGYASITAPDVQQAIDALERADPGL